jgi:3D (Asp-Asp-Asp) domain-containing protein
LKKLTIYLIVAFFLVFGFSNVASASTYQVKKGDTLYSIAKNNNTTVNQIKSWNKLSSNVIKINQVLQVSTASAVKQASTSTVENSAEYKTIKVKATAYTGSCKGCSGITATGINLKKNPSLKVISVDPKVIPLGSKVYVDGYGYAVAGDKGSAIKGNKIDVFIPNHNNAVNWGVKTVNVRIYK